MQLLIRRNQKTGTFGKAKYSLYVRAQLNDEETKLIKKNSLNNELLYYHDVAKRDDESLMGGILRVMKDTALTVGKLIEGTEMTCNNVGELFGAEQKVKEAALMLKSYIQAAATFGGEEVIDMDEVLKDLDGKG